MGPMNVTSKVHCAMWKLHRGKGGDVWLSNGPMSGCLFGGLNLSDFVQNPRETSRSYLIPVR